MEMYLIKSVACMAILMLFYKLLLEEESMHTFKRFFLLSVPIFSFGIPLITFPEYITVSSEGTGFFSETTISTGTADFPLFEWSLPAIYFLGVLSFGSRFLFNLRSLLKRARNNPKVKTSEAIQVLLKDKISPHTFWSYIYLNQENFERNEIPQEVMDHELAHVRQKHTADILFIELLQVILWFLPLIYLLKRAVKLNHEFLADSAVLQKAENLGLYQQILLSFSSGEKNKLVNSINYQSIKKRFTVMKKQPSQKAVLLRTFIFLPLLALLLYSFSGRETVLVENTLKDELLQEKATPEMVAEYNAWAKEIKAAKGEKAITKEKLNRMRYIFSLMTAEQKKNSESFPNINKNNIIVVRQDEQQRSRAEVRQYQEERAAVRQERQIIREERREEREVERKERRETQLERREGQRQVPPPPAPPVPPTPQEGEIPLPPPPPPVPQNVDVPLPPPPPPSPEQAIKNWMEEGAKFFYNGEKVSGKEALEAVQKKNGKNLSIQVQDRDSKKTVRISDNKR